MDDFWCNASALSLDVWSADEDRRLTEYVQSHAGSSWSDLPQATGLEKSYQSCRLRWMTQLCPAIMRATHTEAEQTLVIPLHDNDMTDVADCCSKNTSDFTYHMMKKYLEEVLLEEDAGCEPDISLKLSSYLINESDATCTETNKTNVTQTNSIGIKPMPQDDLHIENKGVIQVDASEKSDTAQNDTHGDEADDYKRDDATCIEQNNTNAGLFYTITGPPAAPQDDLHVQNKSGMQVDSSENIDITRNDPCDDHDNDDQNKNSSPLDTTHILKMPGYRTTKICISREDIEQHFHMNMVDAAASLNVSLSSLKRICRDYGIERWPCRKRKINHQQHANPKNVYKLVQNNNDQKEQSTMTQAKIISPLGNARNTSSYNVIIKARYGDDIIKFRLSLLSGVDELREKICKRLELEVRSFRVKYKDDDGDLVLIACDEDLHDFLGGNSFDIFVFPVSIPLMANFCTKCGTC